MNRLAPFLSEGSPPVKDQGGLKLLKKRQRHFFEKSHTQGCPPLPAEKSAHPAGEVSFPTRMSPEMTGTNFIPSPAGDGTPCGRAFRGENKFASGDEIGADLLYNRGDNGRRRRGYGVEENGAMTVIAHIESQFHTKFGIPRQSGLVEELEADVVFEPQFRDLNALRGLEGFSHIWLIWDFSEVRDKGLDAHCPAAQTGGKPPIGVLPPGPPSVQTLPA